MDGSAPEDRGAGAIDKVVSGVRDGEAPEDRGACPSTEMATAVMHVKAPEDRGAHSPIESERSVTTCMLQRVSMHAVTPEDRGEKVLDSSPNLESSVVTSGIKAVSVLSQGSAKCTLHLVIYNRSRSWESQT